jgi:hypothetical protein
MRLSAMISGEIGSVADCRTMAWELAAGLSGAALSTERGRGRFIGG